jgi:Fur family zinc uptake transcriptional regulator
MNPSSEPHPQAFRPHDHTECRGQALAAAKAACAARRLRLTPARAFVLETLLESHKAMTAYELLERLAAAGLGSQPPVVYRALDFLTEAGFVHRIERLNAYVACCQPGGDHEAGHSSGHGACFLICSGCRKVAEVEDAALDLAVAQAAAARGFAMRRTVLEIEGTCPACRAAAE